MPRNVRNFWIEPRVDGRKTDPAAFGPQGKEGGFCLTVHQRERGGIVKAGQLQGFAHSDGRIVLIWYDAGADEETTLFETER